jgi:diguanylate cyclase (GGDEF)-like protein/PAS domain S-box-containing protein
MNLFKPSCDRLLSDAASFSNDRQDTGSRENRSGSWRQRALEAHVMIPAFAIVLIAIVWLIVIQLVHTQQRAADASTAELSRELADTYEAQLVRNLATIDQTLKTVQFAYLTSGSNSLERLADQGLLPSAMIFRIAIADARGVIVASNRAYPAVDVSNEPWFLAQHELQNDARAPFMGTVTRTAGKDNAEIAFSRRLRDRSGAFGGAVVLSLDPAYLTSNYEGARMGKQGLLAIVGADGLARAERIDETVSWGRVFPTIELVRAQEAQAGHFGITSWDNGMERFTNVRELPAYGLTAVVGISRQEALSAFYERRREEVLWTMLLTIAVTAIAFAMSRSSWQLAMSRRRERLTQQTYFAASEASIDAFLVYKSTKGSTNAASEYVLTASNRRGVEITGVPQERLLGSNLDSTFPGAQAEGLLDDFVAAQKHMQASESEWEQHCADGQTRWLHRQVVPVDDGVVAIIRDVSGRKLNEARRLEQSRILEMIAKSVPLEEVLSRVARVVEGEIHNARCALLLRDASSKFLRVGAAPSLSDQYRETVGFSRIEADGLMSARAIHTRRPMWVNDIAQDLPMKDALLRANLPEARSACSFPILSADGDALGAVALYFIEEHAQLLSDTEAETVALATRIAGIAIQRNEAENRIRYMANHDALTGLPNRTLLSDRLKQVLLHAERFGRGVTVVFVDLDNFKLINDSLGHHAGDELLREVAVRMTRSVRSTDTVVRLGGDEFIILLSEDDQTGKDVVSTVERLRQAVLQPVELQGQKYQVSGSVGFASYPKDGGTAETLLMNADAAMYRAKALGRNNCQAYTADMNQKVHDRLRYQEQLRHALENNEFRLVYQPQVDVETQRMFGVEALIRWHHPTDGLISPATFIPIAEETGLILPIGDWVLHEACRQNKAWQDEGLQPVTVSVNVSARQFLQQGLASRVLRALDETGLEAQYLELEITESVIMQDLEGAISTMRELQEMGIQLSIDDFGTGYSSLSSLKHFPIARLKIDKSFVSDLPASTEDQAIAMAVISLGRQLNLKVIAEGVEREDQLNFLRANNCSEVQGFHYSRPLPPTELSALMKMPPPPWPEASS